MDITIEMNLNLENLQRSGYTILDVLSDVGGIQGLLFSFAAMAIGIANYQNFQTVMAAQLYKIKTSSTKHKSAWSDQEHD